LLPLSTWQAGSAGPPWVGYFVLQLLLLGG